MTTTTEPALESFLVEYLGGWPPEPGHPVTVVGTPLRIRPGWDGIVRGAVGVKSPDAGVISVAPQHAEAVRAGVTDWAEVETALPRAVGRPEARAFLGTFRWSTTPAELPDAGIWLDVHDPRVPPWLHPFGGEVLIALDGDTYMAGVGIKRHNKAGLELSVGTEEAYRGRGLASKLVAQAARWVLAQGAVPIYLHDPRNVASDRTASAAGFPDLGWKILGMASVGQSPG